MKNLIIFISLFFTLQLSAQSDTFYCIQVLSTRNPHLVKPEMVSVLPDTAYIEPAGDYYRILFIYSTKETAEMMLYSWQRQHRDAFIIVRTRKQISKLTKLFTEI